MAAGMTRLPCRTPTSRRVFDAEGPFKDVRQRMYPGLYNDTDRWLGRYGTD
jgi:hypothetical protein